MDTGLRKKLDYDALIERKNNYLMPVLATYYTKPLYVARGDMQYLYDIDGKKYLDFFAGVVTVNSGHCNPEIAEKIIEQVKTLQHTTSLYLTQPVVDLAEKLARISPGNLQKSFICNSGTEATEGATLVAKMYTGRYEFIALRNSFHGRSLMAMALTGQYNWRVGNPYSFGVNFVSSAYCYRCSYGQKYPGCNLECAKDVENIIRTSTSGKIAAFIAEPIQGNGGVVTPPPEYFKEVEAIVKKYGGLMIADEVQTGFGRTGKWFGISQWGVVPDIMTMAKGFGNGWPIGGFMSTTEIVDSLKPGQHFSTFGGNPVASVAALANIEYIESHDLASNSEVLGKYLKNKLLDLMSRHEIIGDVRGMGLMLGVELVKDRDTKAPAKEEMVKVMDRCKDKGLLIGKGGLDGNVIRIKPPLVITRENCDTAIDILDEVLTGVEKEM
ncbi:MAG: aspartate aminotransferase family protein [Chloroflexi bacterium]|nr:aspartate aminotransferase family protein [Chloroflexota bacterium]